MTHAFHDSLPGYHPNQVLHDGCAECEERGRDVTVAINHLDEARFWWAWERAAAWQASGMPALYDVSSAEAPLLRVLWAVQARLGSVR